MWNGLRAWHSSQSLDGLSQSVQAAIIKNTIDWVAEKTFISYHCGGWKSTIKVLADSMFGEGCLHGAETADFSLYPHMAEGQESSQGLLLQQH